VSWPVALCAAVAGGCAELPATNPYDPAAPESVQATGSVVGRLVLPEGFADGRLGGARVLLESGREAPRDAAPDDDGAFAFTKVVGGFYLLRVRVDGLEAEPLGFELGVGGDLDLGEIELSANIEPTATGVATGVVRRAPAVGDAHGGIRVGARDTPFSTATQRDGRFELALPAGRYTLEAEATGYELATIEDVEIIAGARTEPLMAVVRGKPGSVRGRLRVDPSFSRPDLFAGASVTRATTPDGEPEGSAAPEPDGAFIFPAVPAGAWHLRVELAGFEDVVLRAEVRVGAETDLGFLDLPASRTVGALRGTARLAGAPADGHAGIKVQVRDTVFSAETGADGAFHISDVPVNRYGLVLSRAGYGTAALDGVDVGEVESDPVEVVLAAAPGEIVGTLALPAGFDEPGRRTEVELRLYAADGPPDAEPVAPIANPGLDGYFLLDDVGVGRWRVEARADGFRTFADTRLVGPGQRVDLGRVLLEPDLPVGGEQATVVTGVARLGDVPGEAGHGGVRVEVEGAPFTSVTNDAGAFEVTVLGREVEVLQFHRDGYASPPPVEVRGLVRGELNALEGEVVLDARPGQVRGRIVLDRFGDAVRLGQVSVRLADGAQMLPQGVIGPEGGFVLGDVPAGRYTLRASLSGYQPAEVVVPVGVGAAVEVGAVLLRHASGTERAVPLAGRVQRAGATDHTGTRVRVRFADRDRPFALVVTDAGGRFEVPAAEERYNLSFERPGYASINPYGPVLWDGEAFVDPDGAAIDVRLERGQFDGRISVRFDVGPGWIPPAERIATVRVRSPRGAPAPVITAAGAIARFSGLAAGAWVVSVERPGFVGTEQVIEIGPGQASVDIEDAELRLTDLATAQLDLTGVTLSADDLAGVSLVGADLSGVTLTGDFSGADLSAADLGSATLDGVDLRGARLVAARLFGARLRGADLRGAQLTRASLLAADLTPGDDDAPTRLGGADLRFSDFSFAQLRSAVLVGDAEPADGPPCTPPPPAPAAGEPPDGVTRLGGARFTRADLGGAILDGLFLSGSPVIEDAEAPAVQLPGARLVGASLSRACLRAVDLSLGDLSDARLDRADLRGARFVGSVLQRVDLRGADLRGADLLGGVLQRARLGCRETTDGACACAEPLDAVDPGGACDDEAPDLEPAAWDAACGCRTRLVGASLGDANLVGADLTGADLRRVTLVGATTGDVAVAPEAGVPYPAAQPPDCALPEACAWPPGDGCEPRPLPRECRVVATRFAGAALDEAELGGATLNHVDLTGASLRHANLSNASVSSDSALRGLDAAGINLTDTVVAGTDLTGLRAPGARLVRTDLTDTVLIDVDFSGARVEGAVGLRSATVRGLNLSGARISGTELNARARGLDLRGATLEGVDPKLPEGTRLDGATLTLRWTDAHNGPSVRWLSLRGADLTESELLTPLRVSDATGARVGPVASFRPGEVFLRTLLRDADLDGLELLGSEADRGIVEVEEGCNGYYRPRILEPERRWWADCDLRGASLRDVHLARASFIGLPLAGADLTGALLEDVVLFMPDLSGGALEGASLRTTAVVLADLRTAGVAGAELHDVLVAAADLRDVDLRDEVWTGVLLRASDLRGAQLGGARLVGGCVDKVAVTSLAGLTSDNADWYLTDVTDADLTDLTLNGGVLYGVNIEDAASVAGMTLDPAARELASNRVGVGFPADPAGHVCGIVERCDADPATFCAGVEAACADPDYPQNPCLEVGERDRSCQLADTCALWRQGVLEGADIELGCEFNTQACCRNEGPGFDRVNAARGDLRPAADLAEPLTAQDSNLNQTNLSGAEIDLLLSETTCLEADFSDGSGVVRTGQRPLGSTMAGADFSGFTGELHVGAADLRDAAFVGADPSALTLSRVAIRGDSTAAWLAAATETPTDIDLRGASMVNAALAGATLSSVYFDGADLSGADLSGATLQGGRGAAALLAGADLTGATVHDVALWEADLSGATLDGATLRGSPLFCADLSGASLRGAALHELYPLGCIDLTDADLRDVELHSGSLWEATLTGADLTGLDLAGHVLADTELAGATLVNATLVGAVLSRANAAGADLSGAGATGLVAIEVDLSDAVLAGADLAEAVLVGADLARADLTGVVLSRADLTGAGLAGADLRGAIFGRTRLAGADLAGADVCASAPASIRAQAGVVVDDGC